MRISLITHLNERAYKRLLWLSNVSNKSKCSVALTSQSKANAYSINICKKRSFYIYENWFLKADFHKINKQLWFFVTIFIKSILLIIVIKKSQN